MFLDALQTIATPIISPEDFLPRRASGASAEFAERLIHEITPWQRATPHHVYASSSGTWEISPQPLAKRYQLRGDPVYRHPDHGHSGSRINYFEDDVEVLCYFYLGASTQTNGPTSSALSNVPPPTSIMLWTRFAFGLDNIHPNNFTTLVNFEYIMKLSSTLLFALPTTGIVTQINSHRQQCQNKLLVTIAVEMNVLPVALFREPSPQHHGGRHASSPPRWEHGDRGRRGDEDHAPLVAPARRPECNPCHGEGPGRRHGENRARRHEENQAHRHDGEDRDRYYREQTGRARGVDRDREKPRRRPHDEESRHRPRDEAPGHRHGGGMDELEGLFGGFGLGPMGPPRGFGGGFGRGSMFSPPGFGRMGGFGGRGMGGGGMGDMMRRFFDDSDSDDDSYGDYVGGRRRR
ncbi:hypothetical protein K504DRAFT_535703 [Pleomassaria siparia CBS 279.74]|uniref:Uncharacterized protein n=1 Tax=Pleomassaria siparia CBS 279.74 TaxID=1314801 RepID=A0A6G1K2Z1_9PLEO|nr:hypothetical protein K504DRAFT_535703 [Pleomassaria siparia CBS 279.74]